MITKNSDTLLEQSLHSVMDFIDEIVIVDDGSTDDTLSIAKKYKATIYSRHNLDLGSQRAYGLEKCRGEWILMLDADEIVTDELSQDIKRVISNNRLKSNTVGYYIPYQNHFLGKPIYHGGENYKILRLFKREAAVIFNNVIHEHVKVKGITAQLKGKIYHYSYQSLYQTYKKFTDYARREAKRKVLYGENTSIKKVILYPLHMFYARYIKDKGYKDYSLRFLLDLGFAYMEWLTYIFMFFYKNEKKKTKNI